MKLSSKGQVTIPEHMRKKHGLSSASNVELVDQPNGILVVRIARAPRGKQVLRKLLDGGPVDGSTKELLRLTRGK